MCRSRAGSSAPGKMSMSSTGVPASFSTCANSIDQAVAPMMARPGRSPRVRPSRRASGARVKPCSTIVAAISAKTAGITSSAPSTWAAASLVEAMPATAAATMPRGAIQPASTRSRQLRPLRAVASAIAAGRTTKTIAPVSSAIGHERWMNKERSRLAVSTTNRAETRSTTSASLKRASSSRPGMCRLASAMPKMVAAASPAPSITRFETT